MTGIADSMERRTTVMKQAMENSQTQVTLPVHHGFLS